MIKKRHRRSYTDQLVDILTNIIYIKNANVTLSVAHSGQIYRADFNDIRHTYSLEPEKGPRLLFFAKYGLLRIERGIKVCISAT